MLPTTLNETFSLRVADLDNNGGKDLLFASSTSGGRPSVHRSVAGALVWLSDEHGKFNALKDVGRPGAGL